MHTGPVNDAIAFLSHVAPREIAIWLVALVVAYQVFTACYNILLHPLRDVPGPFVAKFRYAVRRQKLHFN